MGVCWELVGETTDDDDDTVTDQTFDDCTTCIGDGTDVNVWLKCSDDSTAALIDTPSSPDDDYAWLCLSNVWVKCYNWAVDEGTADNPDYLEQCGTTPLDCTDLVGWPGSDDFGGTGCDSGAVNDTNYDIRWTETEVGTPTYSVGGGKLNVSIDEPGASIPVSDDFGGVAPNSGSIGDGFWTARWTKNIVTNDITSDAIAAGDLTLVISPNATAGSQSIFYQINQSSNHSGDFYIEVNLDVSGVDNPGGPLSDLLLTVGSTTLAIGYAQTSATGEDGWYTRVGTSRTTFDTSLNGNKTLSIERTGSTVTFRNGGSSIRTTTATGDLSFIGLRASNVGGGTAITQDVTFKYTHITALDGVAGDPILITPTASESAVLTSQLIQSLELVTVLRWLLFLARGRLVMCRMGL
jgi:hypothetical protein